MCSFDISWDEVAKYAVASPESIARVAPILNRYPDRFLFGTDTVAPASRRRTSRCSTCGRRSGALTPEASQKVRQGQLRAALRRSATAGPGVGEGERRSEHRQGEETHNATQRNMRTVGCLGSRSLLFGRRALGLARRRRQRSGTGRQRRTRSPRRSRASRSTALRCSTSATTSSRSIPNWFDTMRRHQAAVVRGSVRRGPQHVRRRAAEPPRRAIVDADVDWAI